MLLIPIKIRFSKLFKQVFSSDEIFVFEFIPEMYMTSMIVLSSTLVLHAMLLTTVNETKVTLLFVLHI